eukprot:6103427-Pyramimonas_sp.AAC.1
MSSALFETGLSQASSGACVQAARVKNGLRLAGLRRTVSCLDACELRSTFEAFRTWRGPTITMSSPQTSWPTESLCCSASP